MREITTHHDGHGLQERLAVHADSMDGGQCNRYLITIFDHSGQSHGSVEIAFHAGDPSEIDPPNGITQEALFAILIDRYKSFQAGPWRCRENALVLMKLKEARLWVRERADDRARRGVLGQNKQ